jgi:hypothetical protein
MGEGGTKTQAACGRGWLAVPAALKTAARRSVLLICAAALLAAAPGLAATSGPAAASSTAGPTSWLTDLNPTLIRSAEPADGIAPLFGGRVNAMAVDAADPRVVYAASEAGGVFVSRDGGGRWRHVDAIAMAATSDVKYMPGHPNVTFIQHCGTATAALTGEFKYDAEPVTSAAGVSRLTATVTRSGLGISWANPASARYRYTLIRIEPSRSPAGTAPYAGVSVYGGTGTKTTARGLVHGHAYTVVAYAVDRYGNISDPARYTVTRY